MPTRRAFIQGGIAVSTLAASPLRVHAAALARPRAIFERDLIEGALFGAEARRQGAAVTPTSSDLGSFWMLDLEPRLRRRAMAITGLTRGAPLFCLELLVRDYGLRPVCRIEHRDVGDGRVKHSVAGPVARDRWLATLANASAEWPAVAATLVGTLPIRATHTAALPGLALVQAQGRPSIFTWMLAPDPSRRALLASH